MRIRVGFFSALAILIVAGFTVVRPAAAQELAGTWQGKLQIDPKTALTIQFAFTKKADGSYSAVLNSPDNGAIKNLAADSVSWKAGAVSVKVASLSGGFDGTLTGGNLSGQWKQPGSSIPLVLSPYQKPVMSKAAAQTLAGTWTAPITGPGGTITFVTAFKADDKGEMQGTLTVPEQGAKAYQMTELLFDGSKLSFKIADVLGQYEGTFANGTVTGLWRQGSPPQPPAGLPVALKKGDYVAKVFALKIPTESFAKLSGTWNGDLHVTTPQGAQTLSIVLRFETNQRADMVGFMDIPAQKVSAVPVTEVTLTGDKLVAKVGPAEFDATLNGKTLTGDWKAGPQSLPLVMTKK